MILLQFTEGLQVFWHSPWAIPLLFLMLKSIIFDDHKQINNLCVVGGFDLAKKKNSKSVWEKGTEQ